MSEAIQQRSRSLHVVRWIEQDIRSRVLNEGDPYHTAEDISSLLGVSRATADRAMGKLAGNRILKRKARSGTFVGDALKGGRGNRKGTMQNVHVLISPDYLQSGLADSAHFVGSISQAIPTAVVHLHFAPDDEAPFHAHQLVRQINDSEQCAGVVLVRASRRVQQIIDASDIPAVIFGSAFPDIRRLSWIDVDQNQAGILAADYAVQRGCNHFVLFMRDHWRQGDNLLVDAVRRRLANAGVGLNQLQVRSTPSDDALLLEQAQSCIGSGNGPIAIICRNDRFAEIAVRASELADSGSESSAVVISTQSATPNPSYCCVVPSIDIGEKLKWVGRSLVERHEEQPRSKLVPTHIVEPEPH